MGQVILTLATYRDVSGLRFVNRNLFHFIDTRFVAL
jgi:hypothetical protein